MLLGPGYYGGKGRIGVRRWICSLLPYDKRGLYCEPFAGMLGILEYLYRKDCQGQLMFDVGE